jgi:hypothetical protein
MTTKKQDLTGADILLAPIFSKTNAITGADPAKQVDIARLGKLFYLGFPSESLAAAKKAEAEAFAKIMKAPAPADDTQAGGAAAPQSGVAAAEGDVKPAEKVTWAKRGKMAMQAKNRNTGRPVDAVLPFMAGKFGLNLFQSTNVSPDDIPTVLEAFKQNGFTMAPPQDDGDGDGPDCYSFMNKDGTHVYMEVDAKGGNIAWVIETADKEITVDGPAPVGDTRQIQSRFAEQQKRAKRAQAAQSVAAPAQAAGAGAAMGAKPGAGAVQKQEKWTRLKPLF